MSTQAQKRFAPKLKIKSGDTVIVTSGEDRGKTAKVLDVFPKENKALVEGVNIIHKHTKPNAQNEKGGIVKQEAPIHISNLKLVVNGQPTRVGRKVENGKSVRIAKTTGEIIK
jgi:large subunit ribosomal protein L24